MTDAKDLHPSHPPLETPEGLESPAEAKDFGLDISRPDLVLPESDIETGFILFWGSQRLEEDETIALDLPIGEERFVSLSMMTLTSGEAKLSSRLDADGTKSRLYIERAHLIDLETASHNDNNSVSDRLAPQRKSILWDRFSTARDGAEWSERRRDLAPAPRSPVRFTREPLRHRMRLWIEVSSRGVQAGERRRLRLRLIVAWKERGFLGIVPRWRTATREVEIQLKVWPVDLRSHREPTHFYGYGGGTVHWNANDDGAYTVSPSSIEEDFRPVFDAYRRIGGDVINWEVHWPDFLRQARIGSRSFPEAVQDVDLTPVRGFELETPSDLQQRLERMPRIDLSHYDPLLELWREQGIRQVDTHTTFLFSPSTGEPSGPFRSLITRSFGADRVAHGSPEALFLFIWLYSELRRWIGDHFEDGFCRIGDEIPAETVPAYIDTAKIVRLAGWRPFTTLSRRPAVSPPLLAQMIPHCEKMQVNFRYLLELRRLLEERFSLHTRTLEIEGGWRAYHTGGARHTWAVRAFGEGSLTGLDFMTIDSFVLKQDGVELRFPDVSPWGNRNPEGGKHLTDVVFMVRDFLYVSPESGTPEDHTYKLKVTSRVPDPQGELLLQLPPGHQVWFYTSGGTRSSMAAYETAYQLPLLAHHERVEGFAFFAFYDWLEERRILERGGSSMRLSPPYAGLHDGMRDAILLAEVRDRSLRQYDHLLGRRRSSRLQLGEETADGWPLPAIANRRDPVAANQARRMALSFLSR